MKDIGYNYERAGGAQIPSPGRGWIWGLTEYKVCPYSIIILYDTLTLIHTLVRTDLVRSLAITAVRVILMQCSFSLSMTSGVQMELRVPLLLIPEMTEIGVAGTPT